MAPAAHLRSMHFFICRSPMHGQPVVNPLYCFFINRFFCEHFPVSQHVLQGFSPSHSFCLACPPKPEPGTQQGKWPGIDPNQCAGTRSIIAPRQRVIAPRGLMQPNGHSGTPPYSLVRLAHHKPFLPSNKPLYCFLSF